MSTWQFNFQFDLDRDRRSEASIKLLDTCGIDFQQLKRRGIDPLYFAEKMTLSGLVLNDRVTWVCFHGCYDFAYLLKTLMNESLPQSKDHFHRLLRIYFPRIYDIKTFQHELDLQFEGGGLNRLADMLGIKRVGTTHQAGSDSLVTSQVFFRLKERYPAKMSHILGKYKCDVYGFDNDHAYSSVNTRVAQQLLEHFSQYELDSESSTALNNEYDQYGNQYYNNGNNIDYSQ